MMEGTTMTKAEFVSMMRRAGLDPAAHDVDALHRAYLRFDGFLAHLETDLPRAEAQPMAIFDPRRPL